MADPLLSVEGVSRGFGGLLAVNGASLSASAGRITALIGPNGAGKTTLFSIISGFLKPSIGRVLYDGINVTGEPPYRLARRGIARTFQIVQPVAGLSVRDHILVGAHLRQPRRPMPTEPRLLLLDEVLAGLNPSEINDIVPVIRGLSGRGIAIVMIEHVMHAGMSLAEQGFVLSEGRVIPQGSPAQVAGDQHVIEAYLGHGAAAKLGGANAL